MNRVPEITQDAEQVPVEPPKLRRATRQARSVSEHEEIVNALSAPAIAMFSASPSLRGAHPEVRDLAKSLSNRVDGCGWLQKVFDVLEDEPLRVIEPSTHTGILARLSGTDVNFTLTTLLMHHFAGPDGQPISRLSAMAASVLAGGAQQSREWVAGVWNLYNWPAIDSNCSLPAGQSATAHWIWNEGTPADIAVFEGRRVILLGPAAYSRTWPAQRTFSAMKAGVAYRGRADARRVRGWLERMAQSRPGPPAAQA